MRDLPLFYAPDIELDGVLPEVEAGHCTRVLRLGVGDEILITDGRGMLFEARLSEVTKKICRVELLGGEVYPPYWQGEITLVLAPTKSIDRMEWLLEKAVEVGVDRLILLKTQHSERKHIKTERLERIMQGAMKQSQKTFLPSLQADCSLSEAMELCSESTRFILHCREPKGDILPRTLISQAYKGVGNVSLFIGPEGDFSEEEILRCQEVGFHPASLGDSRLRTETAALVALQWIHTLQLLEHSTQ